MSEDKRNINSSIGKYLDYLRDLLGGKERNALERNLERDPFEKDAMEGFQSLSANELEADLKGLNKKLSRRVTKSNRVLVYRVAAGIVVILSLSISYLLVFDKQIDEFPENLQVSERIEKKDSAEDKSFELSEKVSNQMENGYIEEDMNESEVRADKAEFDLEETQTIISEEEELDSDVITIAKSVDAVENENIEELNFEFADESMVVMAEEKNESSAMQSTAKKGISAKAEMVNEPVPEAIDNESVTQTTSSRSKKMAESLPVSREESAVTEDVVRSPILTVLDDDIILEEVVIVDSQYEESIADFIPAKPEMGIRKYYKYLDENNRINATIPEKSRVAVVLKFIVSEKGRPELFRIIESPDTTFSKEAIRLVEEGPLWNPSMRSGNYSSEETSLKIIFKN